MKPKLIILFLIVGGIIALVDCVFAIGHSASYILTLTFWTAITEGAIALVASVDTTEGTWINPIKKHLLSLYPILLLLTVMFAFMYTKLDLYPWHDLNGKWLNKNFFMIRNVAVLFITFLAARKYAVESLKESDKKATYAVLYLFAWVLSQSLVAFDWVMSLEYPWVSTLFGGYYFVESFYLGIAAAGVVLFSISKRFPDQYSRYKECSKDLGILMLGWSVVWVGLVFAQFLTIWYGHLPDESSFFIMRIEQPYYKCLMYNVILLSFVIPFVALIFNKTKRSPALMCLIAFVIFAGNILERLVILTPLVHINFFLLILEFIGMAFLFITALDLKNTK